MRKIKWAKPNDQTFLDLPNDILPLVVSHLQLKDNISASYVCKPLYEVCVSFRVSYKSPWLIDSFIADDGSYKLCDSSKGKIYSLKVPEISGFQVRYSKHGWLLMYNPITYQLVFFNPFNRDRIPLPPLPMVPHCQIMAFSCAPTSTSCVLFTVSNISSENITIKTCSPNAKEWNTFMFNNEIPQNYNGFMHIIFSNGVFYCLTDNGCLTSFDPSLNSWNILSKRFPIHHGCVMTEHQGNIFLIYTHCRSKPTVLKLDQTSWKWIWDRTVEGLTIYTNDFSSETVADQMHQSGIIIPSRSIGSTWIIPPFNLPSFDPLL